MQVNETNDSNSRPAEYTWNSVYIIVSPKQYKQQEDISMIKFGTSTSKITSQFDPSPTNTNINAKY